MSFNIDRRPLGFRIDDGRDPERVVIVRDPHPFAVPIVVRLVDALERIAARPCDRDCRRAFPCAACVARKALP